MVDAWEFMGRLATDDTFRDAFRKGPFSRAFAQTGPPSGHPNIPKREYCDLRNMYWTTGKAVGRPVSLMALGEMLCARTMPAFLPAVDDLARQIKATGIQTSNRSRDFYTGLGAMVLDDQMRIGGSQGLDTFGFTDLQGQDRADVLQLAADPAVSTAMNGVCNSSWRPDCGLRVIEWDEHRHPIANH